MTSQTDDSESTPSSNLRQGCTKEHRNAVLQAHQFDASDALRAAWGATGLAAGALAQAALTGQQRVATTCRAGSGKRRVFAQAFSCYKMLTRKKA